MSSRSQQKRGNITEVVKEGGLVCIEVGQSKRHGIMHDRVTFRAFKYLLQSPLTLKYVTGINLANAYSSSYRAYYSSKYSGY